MHLVSVDSADEIVEESGPAVGEVLAEKLDEEPCELVLEEEGWRRG